MDLNNNPNQKLLANSEYSGTSSVVGQNQMMDDFKNRIKDSHRKMSKANEEKGFLQNIPGFNTDALKKTMSQTVEDVGCIARLFTPKRVFFGYGVLDLCFLLFFFIFAVVGKHKGAAWILTILFYVPSVILIIVVAFNDTITTRYIYQRWLRFKLVSQMFLVPITIFIYNESYWEAHICSSIQSLNMSQEQMQKIIDDKSFTLLTSINSEDDSKLGIDQMERKDEKQQGRFMNKITEMRREINNVQIAVRNRLSPTAIQSILELTSGKMTQEEAKEYDGDPIKGDLRLKDNKGAPELPLTEEQKQKRLVQLCATSVVLCSFGIVVIFQILSGHQYFVARRRLQFLEQQGELGEKMLKKFDLKMERKLQKFEEGDPDFLIEELERAQKALEKLNRKYKNKPRPAGGSETGITFGGGFKTSIQ